MCICSNTFFTRHAHSPPILSKHENPPDLHFPLCRQKIEMDFHTLSICSYELNARKQTPTSTMTSVSTVKHYEASTESVSLWTWAKNVKLADGSIYTGNLDRFGKRTGEGTFRHPIYIYGVLDSAKTTALIQWMEYRGEWFNDMPGGYGVVKKYRGDGTNQTIYAGAWVNGQPINNP